MDNKRIDRARALIAKIEEVERECHQIGFTRAAHSVNAAKNAIGWDFAEFMQGRAALSASSGSGK